MIVLSVIHIICNQVVWGELNKMSEKNNGVVSIYTIRVLLFMKVTI